MSHHHSQNSRYGSALEHGKAHQKDHQRWSRRNFMRSVGIAGGVSMLLGKSSLTAAVASPLSMALSESENDRVLVIIRLKGGNDGLNTFIPLYDYGTYRNMRPTVGLKENEITKVTDEFAIPKTLQPLHPLWQEGKMKVLNGVGYADQNLSHFRSSDIWASAQTDDNFDGSGWYGRFIEEQYPGFLDNPPETPPAIQIGGAANVTFNDKNMTNLAISVRDPEEIAEIAQNGEIFSTQFLPDCYYGEQVKFVRSVANNTFFYARILADTYKASRNDVEYSGELGAQLAKVARLIKGGLQTRLFMVTIDGFDTHANQVTDHPVLMNELANAVADFYKDLAFQSRNEDVLCVTISEFGRRIEENGSQGTDHGAAAPVLFFGAGLNGNGFFGQRPDLHDLDEVGNLKHQTDFRSVYATLLENWLCVDSETVDRVLGKHFARIDTLGISCNAATTSTHAILKNNLVHQARYVADGGIIFYYELPKTASVQLEVVNLLGQPVQRLVNTRQSAGEYQISFGRQLGRLARGQYFYRLQVSNEVFSNGFVLR